MSSAMSVITAFVGNVNVRTNYASFGMGVRYFKDGPVHWLNCVVFNPDLIRVVRDYVPKGRFIQVFGRPEVRVWDQNGERRTRDVHVCHQIVLLPRETYSIDDLPPSAPEPDSDLGEPVFHDRDDSSPADETVVL